MTNTANEPLPPRPSQRPTDPLQLLVSGYIIGSLLRGDLDLSLIEIEAETTDNHSAFVVEGKHSRKRLRITIREEREPR